MHDPSSSGLLGKYFAGHPVGLPMLFFSEMWERFCYYGARALLVFALTSQFQFSEQDANKVYGVYTALVYATAILGGWVADRILGFRRSILVGGLIMAAGEFMLFLPSQEMFFYGLALIITGNGLFKPNISTTVGKLYQPGDKTRDRGFVIFYQGINLGAFIAPLLCGWLGEQYGFRFGFLAAGVGMLLGVLTFWRGLDRLGDIGKPPAGKEGTQSILLVVIGAALLSGVVFTLLTKKEWMLTVLSVAMGAVALTLIGIAMTRERVERDRMFGLVILLFANIFFWAMFEQAGSSLNFFAKNWTDRTFFGQEVPAAWFQSINAVCIILMAPLFVWLWKWLDASKRDPSIPVKFGMGIVPLGLGFGVLILGISLTPEGGKASMLWLTALYVLHTCGELCISPVGLSAMTKLAPPSMGGMVMGAWFLSVAVGNFAAGQIASAVGGGEGKNVNAIASAQGYVEVYTPAMWASFGVGAFFLLIGPMVNKLMHGVR
ncbi:MAG: peptide MFS transporter [Planctomycetes bacterium]|nr:peptide MFS transporter [Planctomycetota bacterium]